MRHTQAPSCITPPHILQKLLESSDADVRAAALNTLLTTARLRGERAVRATVTGAAVPAGGRRTIHDCRHSTFLQSAVLARTEDGPRSTDLSVNRAFDGFGVTRQFYRDVFGRDSIDDHGMRLEGYVHRGTAYNNAFWDGQEMVFGDGDGKIFSDFTGSLDVIAHELAHGVTEHTAGLEYHDQPGALNESMSDAMGCMAKQWSLRQKADQADWLIGAEVFTPGVAADALRSMKNPGHAYDSPLLGKDPQPDHMSRFVHLPDTDEGDNGGVHINSGIPNKAFYLAATAIGGFAWEAAGHIWYESLKASGPTTDFQGFADTTDLKAAQLYGSQSAEQRAVRGAWQEVGIIVSGSAAAAPPAPGFDSVEPSINALTAQLERLSEQIETLIEQIPAMADRRPVRP